jgi:hypothetical protein
MVGYEGSAAVMEFELQRRQTKGEREMSKYEALWRRLQADGRGTLRLTFEEIKGILGFEIDHAFLKAKKEAREFGYEVGKISLKERHITFNKGEGK